MTSDPFKPHPVSRRQFVAQAGALAGIGAASLGGRAAAQAGAPAMVRGRGAITIARVGANFEREPLIRPSGFKGGYMTEFWQSAALMQSASGARAVGLGTQNVLWCDPAVLDAFTEGGGNSLMFAVTDRALQMVRGQSFRTPIELLDAILPELYRYAQTTTGLPELRPTFVLNALIPVDNAAWLLYAAENGIRTFDDMVPTEYRPGLSHRHRHVAGLPSVTYALPIEEVVRAASDGYFVIKLKLGHPGTQAEMLQRDMERMTVVVRAVDHLRTPHTADGRLRYDLDPNARYEHKDTLMRLLDHCGKLGVLDRVVVVEEPFPEEHDADVRDVQERGSAPGSLPGAHRGDDGDQRAPAVPPLEADGKLPSVHRRSLAAGAAGSVRAGRRLLPPQRVHLRAVGALPGAGREVNG
jgi:hypothetical protein